VVVLFCFPMLDIAHVIQLATAPVFLLTGVAALLSVLTGRLARVIDRARLLNDQLRNKEEKPAYVHNELKFLRRRMALIDSSITLCTICALSICIVIASLFIGSFWKFDVSMLVVFLFIAGMLALIAALLCFLWEIFAAIRSVRLGLK